MSTRAGLSVSRRALGPGDIGDALDEMAAALLEASGDAKDLVLVGVRTGGVPLAERLRARLEARTGVVPPLGILDITLYRDDVFQGLEQPQVGPTDIRFPLGDKRVVLVDDVLYTGRTVRAALDEIMDFGRPRRILLAVLVDRGGRELPIQADIVGRTLEVGDDETVEVRLTELHDEDAVLVLKRKGDG